MVGRRRSLRRRPATVPITSHRADPQEYQRSGEYAWPQIVPVGNVHWATQARYQRSRSGRCTVNRPWPLVQVVLTVHQCHGPRNWISTGWYW